MKEIKIHPAAASARMMRDDELAALAADITENGLRDPITLGKMNGSKSLVDGRNRLRACELAGIEPRYEEIEFANDDAIRKFVRSRSERRDLTKGERAMQLAFLYPEPDKRGRGNKGKAEETSDFSQKRLSQARSVLRYSMELAEAVRDGMMSLDEALERAKHDQRDLKSADEKHAQLSAEAPDLADQVHKEKLTLGEAWAAFEQRQREQAQLEQNRRETMVRVASSAYTNILALGVPEFLADLEERINDQDFRAELLKYMRIEAREAFSSIEQGAEALAKLVKMLKE